MAIDEIVLPTTEPETEWILGRPVQKVSPFRNHARLQSKFTTALEIWDAGGIGETGTEWRFRVAPPGEIRRPLVPDVSWTRVERLRCLSESDLQAPPLAPDVAVEILSPSDRSSHVQHKVGVYLSAGSSLVIVVDPASRSMILHDVHGTKTLREDEVLEHEALPGFHLHLASYFRALDPPA